MGLRRIAWDCVGLRIRMSPKPNSVISGFCVSERTAHWTPAQRRQ